ncbi:MAG: 3-hydroxyacyl-CoA dehydrogenase [Acidimicrobiia bacterium]
MTEPSTIRWEDAGNGVVNLVLDDPRQSVNTANAAFIASLARVGERIEAERASISGVVISSAKTTFFAGADLDDLRSFDRESAAKFVAQGRELKALLRRLELAVPMVAAIGGAALGGGLEIALSCHRRIVVDDPSIRLGLPEVKFNLLPGGGGIVRTVRMLGVTEALDKVLLPAATFAPGPAAELGLVDELVASPADLLPTAKAWILANPDARQPWDRPDYRMPGGTPSSPEMLAKLISMPAGLRRDAHNDRYPAPIAIMSAAVEGAQVEFEAALEIETRYFRHLLEHPVAKNMVQAFFFDMQSVQRERPRPEGIAPFAPTKVAVLGAGMMGAAIAYVCALAGMHVVLKDITVDAARGGKGYSERLVARAVERGRMTPDEADALLDRILPTDDPADAAGCELVIECVFEDPALKGAVLNEAEPYLADGALLCSNTSTLPITDLAARGPRPTELIGTHFMSPVDKMPLVEIVVGAQTAEATLTRALDLARQLRKTPIVVNDGRGFFTSRVIHCFALEGVSMLAEGVPAPTIEQATLQAGYPVGILQLLDEGNLETVRRVQRQNAAAAESEGRTYEPHTGEAVIDRMIDEYGRPGRIAGAGFYDYDGSGARVALWPGLTAAFPPVADPSAIPIEDLADRLLFIESIETVRCLDEGVLNSIAEANVGSLLAIGYPGWTGGVLQHINGYPGGPAGFAARARELAARYGPRFEPPPSLAAKAARGETYTDEPIPSAP